MKELIKYLLDNLQLDFQGEITLEQVRNERTGDLVDNLEATWRLVDAAGEPVLVDEEAVGGELTKVGDADYDYEFTVTTEQAAALTEGVMYGLEITDGENLSIRWEVRAVFYRGRAG